MLALFLFHPQPDATCPVCSDPSNCQTVSSLDRSSEICVATLEIVVKALEVSNASNIHYVKDFLVVLPTPRCIEQVLLQAIYQLANQNPVACRQVLVYTTAFLPELDLKHRIQQAALELLQTRGLVVHQDYQFDSTGWLEIRAEATATLFAELTDGDRLLLTELVFPVER